MNKREFYAALMSKYTFDNEKIRKNAISIAESLDVELDIDMVSGCCPGLKSYASESRGRVVQTGTADIDSGDVINVVSARDARELHKARGERKAGSRANRRSHFEFVRFNRKLMPALSAAAAVAVFAGIFTVYTVLQKGKTGDVDVTLQTLPTLASEYNGGASAESSEPPARTASDTTADDPAVTTALGVPGVTGVSGTEGGEPGYPSVTSSSDGDGDNSQTKPNDTGEPAATGTAPTYPTLPTPTTPPRSTVYISHDRLVKTYEEQIVLSKLNADDTTDVIVSVAAKSPNLYMFSGRGATVVTATDKSNNRNRLFIADCDKIDEVDVKDVVSGGEILGAPFYDRVTETIYLTVRNADRSTLYSLQAEPVDAAAGLLGSFTDGGKYNAGILASGANVQLLSVSKATTANPLGGYLYVYAVSDGTSVVIKEGSPLYSRNDGVVATFDASGTRIDVSPNFTSFVVVDRVKLTSTYHDGASGTALGAKAPPVVGVTDLTYSDDGGTLSSVTTGKVYRFDGNNLAVVGEVATTTTAPTTPAEPDVTTAAAATPSATTAPVATTAADITSAPATVTSAPDAYETDTAVTTPADTTATTAAAAHS